MSTRRRSHIGVEPVSSIALRRGTAGAGFTLLELVFAVAAVTLLAALVVPTWRGVIERQKIQQSVNDLLHIASALERYRTTHRFTLPESLAEVPGLPARDPWDGPYQYLNFSSDAPDVQGRIRKDRNLHPLNSQFDLYSMGPDRKSSPALTAKTSSDDVIWARDGSFVGVAKDF